KVCLADAVRPADIGKLFGPPRSVQPVVEVVEFGLRDFDPVRSWLWRHASNVGALWDRGCPLRSALARRGPGLSNPIAAPEFMDRPRPISSTSPLVPGETRPIRSPVSVHSGVNYSAC